MSSAQNSKIKAQSLNLLPCPRSLELLPGTFTLPKMAGTPRQGVRSARRANPAIQIIRTSRRDVPDRPEFYALTISKNGIKISFREPGGLHAATATLRQLLRQFGRRLPCLRIRDWPDFPRRGVMLDISRGRVPKLETLLDLADKLADFKINELQLYTEHTFAYRNYKSVWQRWGALTAREIRILDAHCRKLGIDLVPNQNSFGHLRHFLEHPKLKKLAEVSAPYEDGGAPSPANEQSDEGVATTFLRRPTTLAPNHPGTMKFLRGLYDDLLPNFSSRFFNVGCDETWDLGRGQSKKLCERFGRGKVYLDFLKKVHSEVSARGRTMMFWGDIILKYPKLIPEMGFFEGARLSPAAVLPNSEFAAGVDTRGPNLIALNWGYEANHPFEKEAARFARGKIPFYVCPGTSTWQTLIGKHDNALANLRAAAKAGKQFGASGYLICDWGDGGHPNPLAVSWPMFAAGAALAWNAKGFDEQSIVSVLGRDVFGSEKIAETAFKLGFVHRKLGVKTPNETPLGTVIAAPRPEDRELFCRNGLNWFKTIPAAKVRATLKEIEKLHTRLRSGALVERRHSTKSKSTALCRDAATTILEVELDLAARMAAQSCKFMLWQQAAGRVGAPRRPGAAVRRPCPLANKMVQELKQLQRDLKAYWPLRNKAAPRHCRAFLDWRIEDLRQVKHSILEGR